MFRFKASVTKRLQERHLQDFRQRETINNVIVGKHSVENNNEIESSDDDFETRNPARRQIKSSLI